MAKRKPNPAKVREIKKKIVDALMLIGQAYGDQEAFEAAFCEHVRELTVAWPKLRSVIEKA